MRVVVTLGILMFAGGLTAAEPNHCEITVTGESTAKIKADMPAEANQGKLTAQADYWLSDAQLRMALDVTEGMGSKTPAEKQRRVEAAMKRDPRFMLLAINCLTDDGGIIFMTAGKSKYANVPMKPASYPIVANDGPKPGSFTAMFHLSPGGQRERYVVTEAGKLVLSQFDKKRIAGTFTFKAERRGKTPAKVDVAGSFSYRCAGEACQK